MRRHGKKPAGRRLLAAQQRLPAGMAQYLRVLVVVKPGAPHVLVLHRKTERLYQVQAAAGIGRQPDHIAGVGRNFGLDENYIEHGRIVARAQTWER